MTETLDRPRAGCVIAAPSYPAAQPGVDQDYAAFLSAARAKTNRDVEG